MPFSTPTMHVDIDIDPVDLVLGDKCQDTRNVCLVHKKYSERLAIKYSTCGSWKSQYYVVGYADIHIYELVS